MKNAFECPHCGRPIKASALASALGAAGRGSAKRRPVDYAALARKAHEARARNKIAAKT